MCVPPIVSVCVGCKNPKNNKVEFSPAALEAPPAELEVAASVAAPSSCCSPKCKFSLCEKPWVEICAGCEVKSDNKLWLGSQTSANPDFATAAALTLADTPKPTKKPTKLPTKKPTPRPTKRPSAPTVPVDCCGNRCKLAVCVPISGVHVCLGCKAPGVAELAELAAVPVEEEPAVAEAVVAAVEEQVEEEAPLEAPVPYKNCCVDRCGKGKTRSIQVCVTNIIAICLGGSSSSSVPVEMPAIAIA